MLTLAILLGSSFVWGGLIWLCARALQRNNVSGRARQGIWRGAALLLIAPWLAAPAVAAFGWGLAPHEPAATTEAAFTTFQMNPEVISPLVEGVGATTSAAPITLDPMQIVLIVLAIGWVARFVMAQLAAKSLLGILQFARDASPGAMRNAVNAWSRRLGMKRPPRLRIVGERISPFSFGVVRPTVCLPEGLEDRLRPEALDMVIAHECTHVARGDGWLRPLERVTADLLWFNPFAWAIRRELDVARELACDEAVVNVARDRKIYARTLRDIAGYSAGLPAAVPAASMSLAGGDMLLRVSRTLGLADRKPARIVLVSACVLALVGAPLAVAQVMLVTPAPEAPPIPAPPAPPAPPSPGAAIFNTNDGAVRASFAATVVATGGNAAKGYTVRLEGAGAEAGCFAEMKGLGSLAVVQGQTVPKGGLVGQRPPSGAMTFDSSCVSGDPGAMPAPPAPPSPAALVAPIPSPAPMVQVVDRANPRVALVPTPQPLATLNALDQPPPPAPVAPVAPVQPASPIAPPAAVRAPPPPAPPAPVVRLSGAPHAIILEPARATSSYGERLHPITKEKLMHDGIDIAAPLGTEIHAPGPGVVVFAGGRGSYGKVVELQMPEGVQLRFSQLDEIKVTLGQTVAAGTVVGAMGSSGQSTGPHLHLEVRKDGQTVDPAKVNGLVLMKK